MYINSWHIYDQSLTTSLVSFPHHPKPSSDFFGGVRSVDSRLPRRAELNTKLKAKEERECHVAGRGQLRAAQRHGNAKADTGRIDLAGP